MKTFSLLCACLALTIMPFSKASAQDRIFELPLYTGKIPHEIPGPDEEQAERQGDIVRIKNIRKPTLTAYLPPKEKATGTAVVICPGGGYAIVAAEHEGHAVARKFTEQGIAAFVLKYRLPDPKTSTLPEVAPLEDAQQALRLVRENAQDWNITPGKVGIMGFSAGGHVASTAGTHFQKAYIEKPKAVSLRPDFMLLIYPVISADKAIAHQGSFTNLLGKGASSEKLEEFSNEKQVSPQTPPTFLVHAADDKGVPVQNSIAFYEALLAHQVPAELHVYQNGGHGFGLQNPTTPDVWFERCLNWLKANSL